MTFGRLGLFVVAVVVSFVFCTLAVQGRIAIPQGHGNKGKKTKKTKSKNNKKENKTLGTGGVGSS